MNLKKLNSDSVGTHHHEQAVILTDKGEMFVTKDQFSPEGYELVKFQTYDLEQLTTIVNNVLKGNPIASAATVQIEAQTIFVSSVSNLFRIVGYQAGDLLDRIIGGRQAQSITLITDGTPLLVAETGNLKLDGSFTLSTPYSILMLQKVEENWVELTRKINA